LVHWHSMWCPFCGIWFPCSIHYFKEGVLYCCLSLFFWLV